MHPFFLEYKKVIKRKTESNSSLEDIYEYIYCVFNNLEICNNKSHYRRHIFRNNNLIIEYHVLITNQIGPITISWTRFFKPRILNSEILYYRKYIYNQLCLYIFLFVFIFYNFMTNLYFKYERFPVIVNSPSNQLVCVFILELFCDLNNYKYVQSSGFSIPSAPVFEVEIVNIIIPEL